MKRDPKDWMLDNRTPVGIVETENGQEVVRFKDATGTPCHVATSTVLSDKGEPAIWLGTYASTMMLTKESAASLASALARWAEHGTFRS